MNEKLKVMLKWEDGYIVSKCQMHTFKDGIIWNLAKSPGHEKGLNAAAKIFEEHGYQLVDWDEEVEAFDSKATIKIERPDDG